MRSSHEPEGCFAPVAIEPMEGPQEGVLGEVLGLLVAGHQPCHHAEHDIAMALDELLEGVQVAAERGAHEGLIGIGRTRPL